tara:strand:+ start:899 stop:1426 length:528 start_codon:yes stop_codon:yes gene_type:complete
MQDVYEVIKNVEQIYESNTNFQILKDSERVLDELDLYVYENWSNGELAYGPKIERHWVTLGLMWPRAEMPDPMGGKRLLEYDCKVTYKKDHLIVPRKIRKQEDFRPGTKKGKLDRKPIWLVEIMMPKKLIGDMFEGYMTAPPAPTQPQGEQPADAAAVPDAAAAPDAAAPAPEAI